MMTSPAALAGWWILVWSLISFTVMGTDKRAAYCGRARTREATLLAIALFGGWPGTIAGMQWYRHKRQKASFKYRCLLATVCNIWLVWVALTLFAKI